MRKIKKYANRKLYDTGGKRYVSMDRIAEMIRCGEEVEVIDNATGRDITASILSRLLSDEKSEKAVPAGILTQMLRKGSGTLADYARRYTTLWQNALTMAEDEVDRFVAHLVSSKEISSSEGGRLKRDITGAAETMRKWIAGKIDQRIGEVFDSMNLATRDQVRALDDRLSALERRLQRLEQAPPGPEKRSAANADSRPSSHRTPIKRGLSPSPEKK